MFHRLQKSKESTSSMSTSNNSNINNPVVVHNPWWHPHKSWIDTILCYVVAKLAPVSACPLGRSPIEHAESMRTTLTKLSVAALSSGNGGFRKLSKCSSGSDNDIVEAKLKIPRDDSLFVQWGIARNHKDEALFAKSSFPKDKEIVVYLTFPVSLLPCDIQRPTQTNDLGCLVLDKEDDCRSLLVLLQKDTPVVLFYHGGAMTVGHARSSDGVDLMVDTLLKGMSHYNNSDNNTPPVLCAFVQYSQAPEHPFPAAPLEACSVLSRFLDLDYTNVHVGGISAGAYLALVSGLEAYRSHPKRSSLRTILAACPMLNPSAESVSYYENSATPFCPVEFLRWSYREYLNLDRVVQREKPNDTTSTFTNNNKTNDNKNDTNAVLWKASPWRASKFRRLVEPRIDLPFGLHEGPRILLTTNGADPLRDDGVDMAHALVTAGAVVTHFAHPGSHWFGTCFDRPAYAQLLRAWGASIATTTSSSSTTFLHP